MNKRSLILPVILIMLISLACQALTGSQATPPSALGTAIVIQPSLAPSRTPRPTRTTIPTHTPSAGQPNSSSGSSKPVKTAPPEPSPTPIGSYTNNEAGFKFQYPPDWNIDSQSAGHVTINNTSIGMAFIILVDPGDTLDAVATDLKDNTFKGEDVTIADGKNVTLGSGESAKVKELAVKSTQGTLIYRVAFTSFGPHTYALIAVGLPDTLKNQADLLAELYGSATFFPPQPFGTPGDQTLGLLANGDPDASDLDPALTTTSAADYVGLLFSGLVRLGPDLQVNPDLAESWEISADGLVYTFTLRSNLAFSDGTPLTTKDIIYSWERAADPNLKSPTVATYLGDIVGLKDRLNGKTDHISGLKAIDDHTLVVKVDAPKPYFLEKLTYPTAFIVDQNTVTDNPKDWVFQANASGPYMIMKYTETRSLILERNPKYYKQAEVPYVGYLLDAGGSAVSRYEDGTVDILYLGGQNAERVRRTDDPLHNQWQSVTTLCTTFVQMNNNLPPFDDINVRKAFALSVDRAGFVERLTNNMDIPAVTILPPAMPGFSKAISAASYNADQAKAALKASKYAGNLPEIKLNASGFGTQGNPEVDALVATWKQILGIDVKVEFLDPTTFTESARTNPAQMTLYGWCADYPDPQNFLDVLYHTGSDFNVSGYSNPSIDKLLDQANVDLDPASRIKFYNQAEKALLDDFATVPIEHGVYDVLVKPRVQGFVLAPLHASFVPFLSLRK